MLGVIVNTVAVIIGSLIGLLFKKGINKRISDGLMNSVGFATIFIGITGALEGKNTLVLVISLALGALIGFLIDIDKGFNTLSEKVEAKFRKENAEGPTLAQGFVTASLLFCVGAMAVVGSLQAGLSNNNVTLYTKAILDFISSIVLASSLGIGVIFSAITIFVYQGIMVLLSSVISPILTEAIIAEITCVGSLLIVGIGLNLTGATKLKIANFLPAIFLPIGLCPLYDLIASWLSGLIH